MDRETLTKTLVGLGYSKELCDLLDDEALGKLTLEAQTLMSGAPAPQPSDTSPPAPDGGKMSDDDTPTEDEDTNTMSDSDMPDNTAKCSDTPDNPTPGTAPAATTQANAGPVPSQVVVKFSERMSRLQKQADAIEAKHKAADRMARQRLQTEKKHRVQVFCERMVKEGKVLPAEIDQTAGHPTLQDRLMRADCVKVQKFSEKGPAESELDIQMREIEARPVLQRFSERISQPDAPSVSANRRQQLLGFTQLGKSALDKQKASATA